MKSRLYVNHLLREDGAIVDVIDDGDVVAVHIEGYTLQGPYDLVAKVIASAATQLGAIGVSRVEEMA